MSAVVLGASASFNLVNLEGGNLTAVAWLNPNGAEVKSGGDLDLQENQLTGVGGLPCSSGLALLGDGSCQNPGQSFSDVLTQGNTANMNVDMNGKLIKGSVPTGQASYWYFDRKTDGDQEIDSSGEMVTSYGISYSADQTHDLRIWGGFTGRFVDSNTQYNTHCEIELDGNDVIFADTHDIDFNWHWYSYSGIAQGVSSGSHTLDMRCSPQNGHWMLETCNNGDCAFIIAQVIPQ